MTYDHLKKLEKKYQDWLRKFPVSTQVERNEKNAWVIWIKYKKGLSIKDKKEIASELGDIPLKFHEEA